MRPTHRGAEQPWCADVISNAPTGRELTSSRAMHGARIRCSGIERSVPLARLQQTVTRRIWRRSSPSSDSQWLSATASGLASYGTSPARSEVDIASTCNLHSASVRARSAVLTLWQMSTKGTRRLQSNQSSTLRSLAAVTSIRPAVGHHSLHQLDHQMRRHQPVARLAHIFVRSVPCTTGGELEDLSSCTTSSSPPARNEAGDVLALVGEHPSHRRIQAIASNFNLWFRRRDQGIIKHFPHRHSHTNRPIRSNTHVTSSNVTAKQYADNSRQRLRQRFPVVT